MESRDESFKNHRSDVLLSWDRLSFRLLVFSGLGLLWILHGRTLNHPWQVLIRGEVAGILPWVFLAPIVLAISQRARIERVGWGGVVAAHLLGMLLVFIPYWFFHRGVFIAWEWCTEPFRLSALHFLIPSWKSASTLFISNIPIIYLLTLFGVEAMKQARARREEERQAGRLATQLAEARLSLLQRQLHPHFLFNALQAISTLLHRDPKTADALLMRLSSLLRALLDQASGQSLSLKTELELTQKYLDIEQVRFADRLQVQWTLDASLQEIQVPSLIVLPLVENAIRHGLSPKVGPGRLGISAHREGDSLILMVEDDGLGSTLPLGSGVGIGNTRERLEALCGPKARLDIETQPNAGFRARIQIPLNEKTP